ncbi:hypothetical protein GOP47_0023564 [Adiantum capillus-veneris]|uniref:Uncharacterized protein n=1 Tax=Adiantum capillus-veneris TaxID=13818 RepID=A0A9D4Z4K5_ADICA|nr:hypothetical protein GOP47_0023564 [Adiantum capillus-veneris]
MQITLISYLVFWGDSTLSYYCKHTAPPRNGAHGSPRPLLPSHPDLGRWLGGQRILTLHRLPFLERNRCCSLQIDDRSAEGKSVHADQ